MQSYSLCKQRKGPLQHQWCNEHVELAHKLQRELYKLEKSTSILCGEQLDKRETLLKYARRKRDRAKVLNRRRKILRKDL